MLDLVRELCQMDGVSGHEDAIRARIRELAAPYADSIRSDPIGNLIVFRKGRRSTGNRFLMAAHMDEVGIYISSITDDGFLRFVFAGGVDRRVVIGRQVLVGPNRVPGVVGISAVHLAKEKKGKVPPLEELYVDIGAGGREEAEKLVSVGDCGSFVCHPEVFGNGFFKAKAIDDRVGCAVMLKLLQEDLPLDVTFVFTVQEEIGTRGALGAAFSVAPEVALILETTTPAGFPGVPDHRKVCTCGAGPVISYMDGGTIYDRPLFEEMRDLAEAHGIPWQTKEYIAGGNDSRAFQCSRAGVRVAALSAPVRYLHSPASVGSVADFENMLRLARLFLDAMAEKL